MTQEEKPKDAKFKEFLADYDSLVKAKQVAESANISDFTDTRNWLESPSSKKLAKIVFDTARDEGAYAGSADDLAADANALRSAWNAYEIDSSHKYSRHFKPGKDLEETVSGIQKGTLDKILSVEQNNPLLLSVMGKKDREVYQAHLQVQAYDDLGKRAKAGRAALNEEERESLKATVVKTHAKERREALEKKYKKEPKSKHFYSAMEALAHIDMSNRDFGDEKFDGKVAAAVKVMKGYAEQAYNKSVEANEGNDVYKITRKAISKMATGDAKQFEAVTQRLYQTGKN